MVVVISGADMKNPAPAGVFVSADVALQLLRRSGYRFCPLSTTTCSPSWSKRTLSPAVGEALLDEALRCVRRGDVDGIVLSELGAGRRRHCRRWPWRRRARPARRATSDRTVSAES